MVGLVLFAGFALQHTHHCLLGLSMNVTVGGGDKEFAAGIVAERELGCNLIQDSEKWSVLEPTPGNYDFSKLQSDLEGQARQGFTPTFTLKTIDTNKRTLPADLMTEPWDSLKMMVRETQFLKALAKAFPEKMGAVLLGNEVDVCLGEHSTESSHFLAFLRVGRQALQAARPELQVGVTTTFSGLKTHAPMIQELHQDMDLVSMTYYPMGSDFTVLPVAGVTANFKSMLAVAGTKPLYIPEAGYPASPLLGSSEARQTAFVDALFDVISKSGDGLYGVNYFLKVDFDTQLVKSLSTYYGLGSERFKAMISTLGLMKENGTPRAAWAEFK